MNQRKWRSALILFFGNPRVETEKIGVVGGRESTHTNTQICVGCTLLVLGFSVQLVYRLRSYRVRAEAYMDFVMTYLGPRSCCWGWRVFVGNTYHLRSAEIQTNT